MHCPHFTWRIIALVSLLLALSSCDQLKSEYSNRAEAKADRLFERGWLPKSIPASSRQIQVTSDLDLNTGEGEFSFDASEAEAWLAQLEAFPSPRLTEKQQRQGYQSYRLRQGTETWTFLVDAEAGHCTFFVK